MQHLSCVSKEGAPLDGQPWDDYIQGTFCFSNDEVFRFGGDLSLSMLEKCFFCAVPLEKKKQKRGDELSFRFAGQAKTAIRDRTLVLLVFLIALVLLNGFVFHRHSFDAWRNFCRGICIVCRMCSPACLVLFKRSGFTARMRLCSPAGLVLLFLLFFERSCCTSEATSQV